jgi:hypothetical protein
VALDFGNKSVRSIALPSGQSRGLPSSSTSGQCPASQRAWRLPLTWRPCSIAAAAASISGRSCRARRTGSAV